MRDPKKAIVVLALRSHGAEFEASGHDGADRGEAEGGNAFSITIASGHNVPGIPNEQVISIKPLMRESI